MRARGIWHPGGEMAGDDRPCCAAVRRELVRLARAHNHIPPPAEKDYEQALFAEFLARKGKGRDGKGAGARR